MSKVKRELADNCIDTGYWVQGISPAGVDEAGRGPLAGPVAVAAVLLPPFCQLPGVDDSKKLDFEKRLLLAEEIRREAVSYKVVFIYPDVIDEINILQATFQGMRESVSGLMTQPQFVLVDGKDFPITDLQGKAVVKGDQLSLNIAAASILAKVERDHYMIAQNELYPGYGFDRHMGYGTEAHREAILRLGASPIHRRSFLRKMQAENPHIDLFGHLNRF